MPRQSGFNTFRLAGDTAILELTNKHGEVVAEAMVDVADLPMLMEYGKRWSVGGGVSGKRYVMHSYPTTYLHRVLLPDAQFVDHISGDTLDNRRANLRACTHKENARNAQAHRDSTSPFKGVHWNKRERKWRAGICKDRKKHYLGCFPTAEDAARAYDRAARVLFGEFAKLNFADQQPELGKAVGL